MSPMLELAILAGSAVSIFTSIFTYDEEVGVSLPRWVIENLLIVLGICGVILFLRLVF